MLGLVVGDLGTGKTLFLTYLAYKSKERVYTANFTLNLEKAKKIENPFEILEISRGLILIDEAYIFLESRLSSSKLNRFFSHILFTSRKRHLDIVLAAQLSDTIDVRFRELCDVLIMAQGFNGNGFVYYIFNKKGVGRFLIEYSLAQKLFPLFDTYELPESTSHNPYEGKMFYKKVEKIVEKLKEKEDLEKLKKMSKKGIELILAKHNIDIFFAEYVKEYLKTVSS